jgi:luciferase family oxidoreductase group 1
MHTFSNTRYSILDLATVIQGCTPADSFRNSLSLAQHAERLGYSRYWFAEHHNMVSVASSATSVLVGYIAAGTKSIRVGSGGIMLPNHAPLLVAEQFGTLESLYPGRIDLGLGRAPGSDQHTAMAIRGRNFGTEHHFIEDIKTLQTLFSKENCDAKLRAIPGEGLEVPIWILGSSTDSARVAASLGLPYAFASHFAPAMFKDAIRLYRSQFKPSSILQEPYVIACVNVVAADTDAEAARLATSLQQLFIGIITGRRQLLQPPIDDMATIWTAEIAAAVGQMLTYSFTGGKRRLKTLLAAFIEDTGVNEIMATSHIYNHDARLDSYSLLADIMRS